MAATRCSILIAVALAGVTLALYGPIYRSEFVNYDDPEYVTENPQVQAGLTWHGLAWAFTTRHASNWHPLTWLSLQLDASLFGPSSAGGFHLTNVLLHVASTV